LEGATKLFVDHNAAVYRLSPSATVQLVAE
jgi:hemin uptake protein HemP